VPSIQPSTRVLHPRRAALIFAVVVAVVSVALLVFGLQDLVLSRQPLGLVVAAVGCYGLFQIARTPLRLELDETGVLRLRALVRGGAVHASDLSGVELVQAPSLRPDVFRFVRRDGSVAFTSDAALWDVKQLRDLLSSIRVQLTLPRRPR
jgi:hypothetical protein